MASRLSLYNNALSTYLGERTLASLTEDRKPRRILDRVYDEALIFCLEQGQWNFAMRAVEIGASESVESEFGQRYVFTKPEDWIRTCAVSSDDRFQTPITTYADETEYWVADVDPIYVRYISSDPDFGLNLGIWPSTFTEYVTVSLARRACIGVTSDKAMFRDLMNLERRARLDAMAKDALNEAQPRFAPPGTWVTSRTGGKTLGRRNYQRV
jgi:hypothetical protein